MNAACNFRFVKTNISNPVLFLCIKFHILKSLFLFDFGHQWHGIVGWQYRNMTYQAVIFITSLFLFRILAAVGLKIVHEHAPGKVHEAFREEI